MKRLGSSDSLGALMSICPTTEEHSPGHNQVYPRQFQSMLEGLEEEDCGEDSGHIAEKKRRLSVEQVKALEKNFEVENKLEPERKVKLAQELGLQPRQVAVWFQNRRARWKTKQLERDYGLLKASFEALKHNYETLQHDNEALLKEIGELKSKQHEENSESNASVKEEAMLSENEDKVVEDTKPPTNSLSKREAAELNYKSFTTNNYNNNGVVGDSLLPDFKDGSSDSDSSAILNEENNSPNAAISSSGVLQGHQFLISNESSMLKFNCSSSSSPSSMNCFHFSEAKSILGDDAQKAYLPQFVKIEEHNFFGGDESCNFFSDEQAPTLQWYCPDHWT
ncbi:unnamed protein product [Ilex paraguariensis]|uniref:Homeobox-leucine zipper protein n=1 Tax=Ilex paraguariensis TaxID=185542 RepID=A0ABC8TSM6_9AQUA